MGRKTFFKTKSTSALLVLVMLAALFSALPVFGAEVASTLPTPTPTPATSAGGSIYITGYTVMDGAGNEISSVGAGQKCCIAVAVQDDRVENRLEQLSNINIKVTSNDNYISPSRGDIRVQEVHGSNSYDWSYGLQFLVIFNDITYNGGENTLAFDLSYNDQSQEITNLSVGIAACGAGQAASSGVQPIIMVSSSNYGGKTIVAGSVFTLSINAYNTSAETPLNTVITQLTLPDGVSLAGGNNNALTRAVGAGGSFSNSFTLKAGNAVQTGMLNFTVNYTFYADGKPEQLTSNQIIAVPVAQPDRFSFSTVSTPTDLVVGSSDVLSVNFINKGKDILYNLTATIDGTNIGTSGQEQFIGNVAAGTKNSVDFDIAPELAGNATGTVTVTYEDIDGNLINQKVDFSVPVGEAPVYEDPGFVDEPIVPEQTGFPWWIIVLVVIVLACVGITVFKVIKKKAAAKKEAADADDEDDDNEDF